MAEKLRKNDIAWKAIFESRLKPLQEIQRKGYFYITADEIKKYGNREPRLITKIDHSVETPKIFNEHNLSILPTKRGEYIIGPFKTHEKLNYDEEELSIKWVQLPEGIKTINPSNITSESMALNAAHISGMLEDFIGESVCLTVNGRMSSKEFEFYVGHLDNCQTLISVENSQIEIDGGYEGKTKFVLIEAKNKVPQDFLIRQLYYPYALWRNQVSEKKVIPILFTYTDNVFSFFEYKFKEHDNYSSLSLVRKRHYSLKLRDDITREEIINYLKNSEKYDVEHERTPFPQADNMLRVLNLIKQMAVAKDVSDDNKNEEMLPKTPTAIEVANFYGLAERQGAYYGDALAYLGLCKKEKGKYHLTKLGRDIYRYDVNDRIRIILQQFFKSPVIRQAYKFKVENDGKIEKDYVTQLIFDYVSKLKGNSTRKRRARTIISWINWAYSYHK